MKIGLISIGTTEDFRILADASPLATIILRPSDDNLVFANTPGTALFGEGVSKCAASSLWAKPDQFNALMSEALANGQAEEYALLNTLAGPQRFKVFSKSLADESLVLVHFVDLGEAHATEQDLRKKIDSLSNANAELEQFAYIASHDLQEPLRMVNGYMQLLKQRYSGQLDRDADEFINFAVDGATRMQQMINDLLVFSRVQTRGKELQLTDAGHAFDNALENLNFAVAEVSGDVKRDALPHVIADATQLTMLFQNLLTNSLKFIDPAVPPQVRVTASASDNEATFCVSDNGIGIDPQYFEKIFAIFRKLHTREQYSGTGIGLAVCKRIVARHGGRIWVESSPGAGARFFFTLKTVSRASK